MKKIFYTLLTACLLGAGSACAQTWDCGYCGEYNSGCTPTNAVTATLTNGTLTISGSGDMADYSHFSMGITAPWYSARTSIQTVIIENGVTSIGSWAFNVCSNLVEVTIPSSVIEIGSRAFGNCSGLTAVTIGSSVTTIDDDAFSACNGLTSIEVVPDNPSYSSKNGVLFSKNKVRLIIYPGGKQGAYTIPSSVIEIGSSAFANCDGLTAVTIPSSVTKIGYSAFWSCIGLTSVISLSATPSTAYSGTFQGVNSACCLYVPTAAAVAVYQTTTGWSSFTCTQAMDNSSLASLSVSSDTLSPAFSPNSTNYTCTVSYSVSEFTITATPENAHATVAGAGVKNLNVGSNMFSIIVTAQDSVTTKTYTLTVTRQAETPTAVAKEEQAVVKLYPNPVVNGQLTMDNGQWKAGEAIEIYSLNGALVATYKTIGEKTSLNISQLPNGTYLLRVGGYTAKFVKR